MITFLIDGDLPIRGYQLVADSEHDSATVRSAVLTTPLEAALQARALVDVAAALLESFVETPEYERAFELLHDALDVLPSGESNA